jgi:NADH:ubiquinone oxidoreductase subunit 4 (subunit M)
MTESTERYPIAALHRFLEEASEEFRRLRFQATVNLTGSVVLLVFLARFALFLSVTYGWGPLQIRIRGPFIVDSLLLLAALAAVIWSLDV